MIAGSQMLRDGVLRTAEARFESDSILVAADGGGRLQKIMVRFLRGNYFQVPIGYEDAGGFHFGAMPVSRRADRILSVQLPAEVTMTACGCEADELCCLI